MQVKKFRSPRAKRKRTVNSNKTVVEGIDAYLPNNRQQLTPRAPCSTNAANTLLNASHVPWLGGNSFSSDRGCAQDLMAVSCQDLVRPLSLAVRHLS